MGSSQGSQIAATLLGKCSRGVLKQFGNIEKHERTIGLKIEPVHNLRHQLMGSSQSSQIAVIPLWKSSHLEGISLYTYNQ